MKRLLILLALVGLSRPMAAQFRITKDQTVTVSVSSAEAPVVHSALELLERDLYNVLGCSVLQNGDNPLIIIKTIGTTDSRGIKRAARKLKGKREAFDLKVQRDGTLLILGSDAHGTAYGIMELSRMLGVSPWEWWADAVPEKKERLEIRKGFHTFQQPSVDYRGIFVNDEDWGLLKWSSGNYEPVPFADGVGEIGPETNARIFELLLRLKANTFWPAMHSCTKPFFMTEGNRETAEKYGIYIGSSHCEPMACNSNGEWSVRGEGEYDFVNNRAGVLDFWEERVKEVSDQEVIYTLGMRGIHDGPMAGVHNPEDAKAVLGDIVREQRELLRRNVSGDVTEVPQVFIPYKEVLDIYRSGMEVPEDVTLMWCDDNYGYIRHFPNKAERKRPGGNGVYYHLSYWGRPHDYLWLGTFNPYLLYNQMSTAFDSGIRKMWIANVGDIKPAEYQIELFMDMAWDMDRVRKDGVTGHLKRFLAREFGDDVAPKLLDVMREHYRLAFICKPEFMGGTRTEEPDWLEYSTVKDHPWTRSFIDDRIASYDEIANTVRECASRIPPHRRDVFYQLVEYPVLASATMNKKFLFAQRARHGEGSWEDSDREYDAIVDLTERYNSGFDNGGKWNLIMDPKPRNLPVFQRVPHTVATSGFATFASQLLPAESSVEPLPMPDIEPACHLKAVDCTVRKSWISEGLGWEDDAVSLPEGKAISFRFPDFQADSLEVEVRLLPVHPMDTEKGLAVTVSLDGGTPLMVRYDTRDRSEEWKINVLTNHAVRSFKFRNTGKRNHRIKLRAMTQGVVVDDLIIR